MFSAMADSTIEITILDGADATSVQAAVVGDAVFVDPDSLTDAIGWQLKPEGLCRGDVCVPVRDHAALTTDRGVDLSAVAAALDKPAVVDPEAGVVGLGTAVAERRATWSNGLAPEFTLPDLGGTPHSLSDFRDQKVLLVAWASW